MVRTRLVVKLRDLVECSGTQSPSLIAHGQIIADIRPSGKIFRKCGLGWSVQPMLIALRLKVMPASSVKIVIFLAFGVG